MISGKGLNCKGAKLIFKSNTKKLNEIGHLERDEKLEQQTWIKGQVKLVEGSPIVQTCQQLPSLSPEQPGPSLTPTTRGPDSTAMGIFVINPGVL